MKTPKPVIVIKKNVPTFLTIRTDILKKEWSKAESEIALSQRIDYNKGIQHLIKQILGLDFTKGG